MQSVNRNTIFFAMEHGKVVPNSFRSNPGRVERSFKRNSGVSVVQGNIFFRRTEQREFVPYELDRVTNTTG